MEMNRYLIAALYVMAGCVVAVPLKAQAGAESLKGERCRQVINTAVRIVSVCLEESTSEQSHDSVLAKKEYISDFEVFKKDFSVKKSNWPASGPLCRIFHKIRAPEFVIR